MNTYAEEIATEKSERDNRSKTKPKSPKAICQASHSPAADTIKRAAAGRSCDEVQKKGGHKKSGKRKGRKKSRRKRTGKVVSVYWFVAAAVLTVAAFVVVPLLVSRCSGDTGVQVPEGHYGYAVDISKYQKDIVWDSLMVLTDAHGHTMRSIKSASGIHRVKYVMIKATEGERHHDALFGDHWKRSAEAGYSRGAYHFFRSSKSPEKQAQNFIRTVGNIRHRDLPPILDVETIHAGCSNAELNRRLLVWLGIVEEHYGRRPIIYTGDAFLRERLSPEVYECYPVWIARYGSGRGLEPPRFKNWMMWQFTDHATVYGIPSLCDLSVVAVQQQ